MASFTNPNYDANAAKDSKDATPSGGTAAATTNIPLGDTNPMSAPVADYTPETKRGKIIEQAKKPARLIAKVFPVGSKDEAITILKLAWPVVLANFLYVIPFTISMAFAGRLGTETLDAVALALTFVNLTGTSVGFGLATALDTLLSQTYAANPKNVGAVLQRGCIIIFLFCIPCWCLYINIEAIMIGIGEPVDISRMGYVYVLAYIPGLPGFVFLNVISKYIQNQDIVRPPLVAGVFVNCLNAALHGLFMFAIKGGPGGAAAALGVSFWAGGIALVIYIKVRGLHKETWQGFTMDAFQEWGQFSKLAIPGLLMVSLEFWNYEIGTLVAGTLGKKDLAAQAIAYQFAMLGVQLGLGLGIAVSIRIGHHLGEGHPDKAKMAARICLGFGIIGAFVISLLLGTLRNVIPKGFSADKTVVRITGEILAVLAVSLFFDNFQQLGSGILRGCARQQIGAMVNFIGFYVVGLPVGLVLMLRSSQRVTGFWVGTTLGTFTQAVSFLIITSIIDWKRESDKAIERAGMEQRKLAVDQAVSDLSSRPSHYSAESGTVSVEDKSTAVIDHTDVSVKDGQTTVTPPAGTTDDTAEIVAQSEKYQSADIDRLPMRTLIIRRGGVFLALILFFVVCLIIRFTVPYPPVKKEHHNGTTHRPPHHGLNLMEALFSPTPDPWW